VKRFAAIGTRPACQTQGEECNNWKEKDNTDEKKIYVEYSSRKPKATRHRQKQDYGREEPQNA